MRPIELTPRLQAVAGLVPLGARLADVGTDHAYLPASLLQQGVIDTAVAADLRPGPLDRARATAERYGLTERISFRLCDGLSGILPEEADTVVIAGMGGETIAAILSAAPWVREEGKRLILQPMSAQEDLRAWLADNGYRIEREVLSREGETLYVAMLVTAGEMGPMTPAQLWAGRQSQEQPDPLRGLWLDKLRGKTARAVEGLRRSSREGDRARLERLEEVLEGLDKMKEEWDSWQR